ncbi:hypothetical protein D8S78_17120 [Natrialba swarupiae]|nr:hypothetical protein [Natrialba swarupiae]
MVTPASNAVSTESMLPRGPMNALSVNWANRSVISPERRVSWTSGMPTTEFTTSGIGLEGGFQSPRLDRVFVGPRSTPRHPVVFYSASVVGRRGEKLGTRLEFVDKSYATIANLSEVSETARRGLRGRRKSTSRDRRRPRATRGFRAE